jgi:hypothetical protein
MKNYGQSKEALMDYEKLNQTIASVPKHEQEMAQKLINAFAEGFAEGCRLRHQSNRPAGR